MYWLDTVYIPNLATVKRLQHTGTKRNQTNCLLLWLNLANENSQNQQKTKQKSFPHKFFQIQKLATMFKWMISVRIVLL